MAALAPTASAEDATVWGAVWVDPLFTFDEMTVQRFTEFGEPDVVLGNGFDSFGNHFCLTISGDVMYSGDFYSVYQWDAATGNAIGTLNLDDPLSQHIENYLISMGTASNGDLLMVGAGFSTELRTLTRYTTDGRWVRDYVSPELMHTQGSPVATDEAVFIASRFNTTGTWDEQILVFETDGNLVGRFGGELGGDVGDLALRDNTLFAINYADQRIFEYELNGAAIPTFITSYALPSNVNPDAFALDRFAVNNDRFIVGDSNDYVWYEIDLAGNVYGAYEADVPPGAVWNFLGPVVIYDSGGGGGDELELALNGNCPGTMFFDVTNATPNGQVALAWGTRSGSTPIPPCPGLSLDFAGATRAAITRADAGGQLQFVEFVPSQGCGRAMVQVVDVDTCRKSNVVMP